MCGHLFDFFRRRDQVDASGACDHAHDAHGGHQRKAIKSLRISKNPCKGQRHPQHQEEEQEEEQERIQAPGNVKDLVGKSRTIPMDLGRDPERDPKKDPERDPDRTGGESLKNPPENGEGGRWSI